MQRSTKTVLISCECPRRAGNEYLRRVNQFAIPVTRDAPNQLRDSRFIREPSARERCPIKAPGMPGGPSMVFKGLRGPMAGDQGIGIPWCVGMAPAARGSFRAQAGTSGSPGADKLEQASFLITAPAQSRLSIPAALVLLHRLHSLQVLAKSPLLQTFLRE